MTWNLVEATVDLHGYLNVSDNSYLWLTSKLTCRYSQFIPNIQYWLNANNTYRVVFIQVRRPRLLPQGLTDADLERRTRHHGLSSPAGRS